MTASPSDVIPSDVIPGAPADRSATPRTIRVASVPSSHVYIRHLSPLHPLAGLPEIERLPDPDPAQPNRPAGAQWWPPVMLDPEWVRSNRDFDVFHLQFGFDARSPEDLAELVRALRETGRPLVYTVHDLRNPHHLARDEHDAQLDVLIPAADALITLTEGAAAEIRRRWGREALVLPHPHVVPFERMAQARPRAEDEFRIGVHVKSVRASMDPLPVIRTLIDTVRALPGAVLQVNGHRDVLEADGARYQPELAETLREAWRARQIDLRVHDFLPDDDLWDYFASLDASVLPYRFGTHSGWLEACRDLGTAVIAPDCGYYRDQGPVFEYTHNEFGLDAVSLADAVVRAYEERIAAPSRIDARRAQRQHVATVHALLYAELLGMTPEASAPAATLLPAEGEAA